MKSRRPGLLDRISRKRFGLVLILPVLIGLGIIVGYPFAYNIFLSFSEIKISSGGFHASYIGLQNYIDLIRDIKFWTAFKNLLTLAIIAVGGEIGLGLALALVLNKKLKGSAIFQGLLVIPMMMAPVTIGLLWRWMYSEEYGAINHLLKIVGINGLHWLSDPDVALYSLAIIDIWQMFPFVMLILLAGLKVLPLEPFEAAKIDGASGWQTFWYLTVPLLSPVLLVVLLIRTTDIFRIFDTIYVLTGGGPGLSTEVLCTLAYRTSFAFLKFGKGSAISLISLIFSVAVGLIYIKTLRRLESVVAGE